MITKRSLPEPCLCIPPKVNGKIRGQLSLSIKCIKLNQNFHGKQSNPIVARMQWWGDTIACFIHPRIEFHNPNNINVSNDNISDIYQNLVFEIRAIPRRLIAYFTDMGQLIIDFYQCKKAWSVKKCISHCKQNATKKRKFTENWKLFFIEINTHEIQ